MISHDLAGQFTSLRRAMRRFGNISCSCQRSLLHCGRRHHLLKLQFWKVHIFKIRLHQMGDHVAVPFTINYDSLSSLILKKKGSITPSGQNAHHTVTSCECISLFWIGRGFSELLMRQFCLLTKPNEWKFALFEKMIFMKSSFSSCLSKIHRENILPFSVVSLFQFLC